MKTGSPGVGCASRINRRQAADRDRRHFGAWSGAQLHSHPHQEEVVYVIGGKVEQWVGNENRILSFGDAAFIPAGKVHASFNAGEGIVRLVAIFGPSIGDGFETIDNSNDVTLEQHAGQAGGIVKATAAMAPLFVLFLFLTDGKSPPYRLDLKGVGSDDIAGCDHCVPGGGRRSH